MPDNIFLTRKGYEKLMEDLKELRGRKRREIANALESARQLGDLSENAEYDAAKQSQAVNERRISELEQKLGRARILENEKIPDNGKAYIGAIVTMSDMDSGEEIVYTLVTEDEADFGQGKISIASPVGTALLGKEKDDIVNIRVPAGPLKYKITKVSR